MHHRHRVGLDGEVLPEPVATHLLARACELDAARLHGTTVAELRAAAAEAGISPAAFDAALDELQDVEEARLPDVSGEHQPRTRRWALAAGVSALIAAGTLAVLQDRASSGAAGPMTEEAFLLRCLSPGDVAELVRPLLRLPMNTVVYSHAHAARVLTIRATPAQMQRVRSVLDQYEGAGSRPCAPTPAPAVTP